MNLHDILSLVNAGYTRAEIEAMDTAPGTNDPTPVTPPDTQPGATPATTPAAPFQPSAQDLLAQILERMGPAAPVQQRPAPAPAQPAAPVPAQPAAPAQPTTAEGDASRILKALGALAQGVDVPNNELSIDKKMENTIKMALGVKVE